MNTQNATAQGINGVELAWGATLLALPKILLFLLILVVGYFVAIALGKVVDRVLEKVGFDRAIDRGGIKRAMINSGYAPSDLIGRITFYTAMLFVLELAFSMFGPNAVSDVLTRTIAFLPNIFVALVIVVVSSSIAAGVRDVVRSALGGLSYGRSMANIAGTAIVLIGAFAALNQLNIAPAIVIGVFYAMLAIIVGVSIVAIGGAGIVPLRSRWESALNKIEVEVPRVQQTANVRNGEPVPLYPTDPARQSSGGYVG